MNALKEIDFNTASLRSALATCKATKQAQESAVWQHHKVAMEFKASRAWEADYKSWNACCAANPDSLFSASYYRTLSSSLPIAQAMELATGESLLPTQAKVLQGKLWEIIPESEREAPLMLSMLALSYAAYPDKVVPDRNVLDEAYQILAEERDSGTITTPSGDTFVLKDEAQIARLKERVLIDRMNGNKPRLSLRIAANQAILAILQSQWPNKPLPPIGAEITLLWNEV